MSLKILLADDSMTAQSMGKKILSDAGYEVMTVSNGAAAVRKLSEFRPDIVIADVYMPGYNGLEVCERVKTTPDMARVPVLLSVGKLEPFRAEEGMRVKADGIIVKPFEATDLLAVTEKLAERCGMTPPAPPAAPAPVVSAQPEPEPEPEEPQIEPTAHPAESIIAPVPAVAQPVFELAGDIPAVEQTSDSQLPDYVREFGLEMDPAAPDVAAEHAPVASSPAFEISLDDAPPAALAETDVSSAPQFEIPIEQAPPAPVAETTTAHDPLSDSEFEAKLAAAMDMLDLEQDDELAEVSIDVPAPAQAADAPAHDLEITLDEPLSPEPEFELEQLQPAPAMSWELEPSEPKPLEQPAVSEAPVLAASQAAWVTEEAHVEEFEHAVSLEQEMQVFEATHAIAAASTPEPQPTVTVAMPPGPIGDTSFDDELANIMDAAAERFMPSQQASPEPDLEITTAGDELADNVQVAVEPAGDFELEIETEPTDKFESPVPEVAALQAQPRDVELDLGVADEFAAVVPEPELAPTESVFVEEAPVLVERASDDEIASDPFAAVQPAELVSSLSQIEELEVVTAAEQHAFDQEIELDVPAIAAAPVAEPAPLTQETTQDQAQESHETGQVTAVEQLVAEIVDGVFARLRPEIAEQVVRELKRRI